MAEMKKEIAVYMNRGLKEAFEDAKDIVENPEKFDEYPDNAIYLKDCREARKILTPRRLELLQEIDNDEGQNLVYYSKKLKRDKQNISRDMKDLEKLGVVTLRRQGRDVIPKLNIRKLVISFGSKSSG